MKVDETRAPAATGNNGIPQPPPLPIDLGLEDPDFSPEEVLTRLVDYAAELGASDIFFSTNEHDVDVTVRHLGMIKFVTSMSVEAGVRCIAHIRAMSGMRFGEKRHPQDGRWMVRRSNGSIIDLRLNTMPTLYGESVAMRILERDSTLRNLESLGLTKVQLGALTNLLDRPSGLILVTGPTGSGKTTTMYACLHYLNDGTRKMHTLEDPIEYSVPGLHQTQLDEAKGATVVELLRGVVRQGPDVIMIGEVRDKSSAETAVRAANSGQLVLATVHAPVAASAIQSMIGMGISPYFLCTSLSAVVGQRLVRTLDERTRIPIDLSDVPQTFDDVRHWMSDGHGGEMVFAAGAGENNSEGYIGRTGIFEVLTMTPELQQLVADMQPAHVVAKKAVEDGMIDLPRAALLKVAEGVTTFDEMYRVVPTEDDWVHY